MLFFSVSTFICIHKLKIDMKKQISKHVSLSKPKYDCALMHSHIKKINRDAVIGSKRHN